MSWGMGEEREREIPIKEKDQSSGRAWKGVVHCMTYYGTDTTIEVRKVSGERSAKQLTVPDTPIYHITY